MIPLIPSGFVVEHTVCLTRSISVYDTYARVATVDAYEKPKVANLLPMPAITPLKKKFVREMSGFDKQYEW